MNFDISALPEDLSIGLRQLRNDYKFSVDGSTVLTAKKDFACGVFENKNGYELHYSKQCEFYREFAKLLVGEKTAYEKCAFEKTGVMIDCSRNAVMKVDALKRYVRLLAVMGYDTLMLYMEDTFAVDGEPFFGYMRGGYTKEELKELDEYAKPLGVEIVPCIQTLAHFDTLKRWERFKPIMDCNDILLVGDESTYELIDKMFGALRDSLSTRRVHIGMDEAHMVGLGKYLDAHGYENRFDIILKHLARVRQIAHRHGFCDLTMWSDMFFRLANSGKYEIAEKGLPDDVLELIPQDITLMFWDYYNNDESHYERMLAAHKAMSDRIAFAGGAWRWNGFTPSNTMSYNRNKLAFDACKNCGVKEVLLTMWGDNGGECSSYAVLPSLVASIEYAYGNADYKKAFNRVVGVDFDDFMCLEAADALMENRTEFYGGNYTKVFLYNDLFYGLYDFAVDPTFKQKFEDAVDRIARVSKRMGKYSCLFRTSSALAALVAVKYDLGARIYDAYKRGDKAALKVCADEVPVTVRALDKFYKAYKAQWDFENKPFGFEVQDIRLGGLKQRLLHCRERLVEYCNGRSDNIPELEADKFPLRDYSNGSEFRCDQWWHEIVSVNMI